MAGRNEAESEAYVASDGGRLLGFALLLAGNYQDAEDLVQTALLRSAGRWPAARQNPPAYTRTVLVNLARDRWRACLLYTSPSPRDGLLSRMPSSA